MDKLAVFFPGIGYTVDNPLLYYSRKLAEKHGYEIQLIPYGNFPQKVQGDPMRMRKAFKMALQQAKEMLAEVDFSSYEEVLFVGKSIGTIVAATIAQEIKSVPVRLLLYTPLEETFSIQMQDALAFSGTRDPWVGGENSPIGKLCYEKNIRCISLENANHSLETGHLDTDLEYLKLVMQMTEKFMERV